MVRHGRLAAAGTSPPRLHPQPTLDAILATAETVRPGAGPVPCASPAETERILAWLERSETRLVRLGTADGAHAGAPDAARQGVGWASPAAGGPWRRLLSVAEAADKHGPIDGAIL